MENTKPHTTESCAPIESQTIRDMSEARRSTAFSRLWARLANTYGADRWERAYGVEAPEAWRHGLGHCTLDALARGIEVAERDDSGRLPTLGVFRLWCREFQPGTFAGAAAPEPKAAPLPQLEHVAGQSTCGRKWLSLMHLDGLVPIPEGMSRDDVEAALDDADIGAMRAMVAQEFKRMGKIIEAVK